MSSVLLLSACAQTEGTNWPGLAAEGNTVYVSYQQNVTALDASDQSVVWTYADTENAGVNFYAPPSVSGDSIIVGDNGVSAGLFAGGGFIVGIHALPVGSTTTPQPQWVANDVVTGRVFGEALQVDEKIFFGTADNHFVALNASDGSKIWDYRTENAIWSQPAYYNGTIFLSSLDKNVYAFDAGTGEVIWQAPLAGASASAPVINESAGLLYVGSFDGLMHAYDIKTGEEVWTSETTDWIWGTAALHNDVLYFADMAGNVLAVDAITGRAIWNASVPESSQAEPLIFQDMLFIASGNIEANVGHLTAFTLDGEEVWSKETTGALSASPVAAGDSVVVAFATEDLVLNVLFYGPANGDVLGTYEPATE